MKRGVIWGLSVALLLVVGWHFRPLDPDAWRLFARSATDRELEQLVSDDHSRDLDDRWKRYLAALQSGDEEAFRVARRLCPLIVLDVHPSEEFLGALGWNLERRPAEVFELLKPCFPGSLVCQSLDHDTKSELLEASIERRRSAVSALLDAGHSDSARDCLAELGN